MANYITLNSKFEPYSFERYIQPYQIYGEAYNAQQDAYTDLSDKIGKIRAMISETMDPKSNEMYNNYLNELNNQADDLAKNGLSAASRRNLLGLRQNYNSNIVPIEEAYNRRKELIDEQRKNNINGNMLYSTDFGTVSLDDMIANPNMSYTSVDTDDLYKKGKEIAATMSELRQSEAVRTMGNQYWSIATGYGEDAANAFLLDSGAIPELDEALEDLLASSGVTDNNRDKATKAIASGMIAGMSYKEKLERNLNFQSDAEREQAARYEEDNLTKSYGPLLSNGSRIKPVGGGAIMITTPKDGVYIVKSNNQDMQKNADRDLKMRELSMKELKELNSRNDKEAAEELRKRAIKPIIFEVRRDKLRGSIKVLDDKHDNEGLVKSKEFSEKDKKLINSNELPSSILISLQQKLAEQGLTIDEVNIYKDKDSMSNDHYKVIYKGLDPNNKAIEAASANDIATTSVDSVATKNSIPTNTMQLTENSGLNIQQVIPGENGSSSINHSEVQKMLDEYNNIQEYNPNIGL